MISLECPDCGAVQERHDSMLAGAPAEPEAGDASLCFNCLRFSLFDTDASGGLLRRPPTNAEFRELLGDVDVMRVYAAAAYMRQQQKPSSST